MITPYGHLTYCSNIHTGEDWQHHFGILQESIPAIKKSVSPQNPMGIGLRLANQASIDLSDPGNLLALKRWLQESDCYVFTMNGFPYGGFHNVVVKDQVHAPDWTHQERVDYTIRLFHILAEILPEDLNEGGISTSPLSYRFWWNEAQALEKATQKATLNMLSVVDRLIDIREKTGKILHLDIEPEPDGILGNAADFISWYQHVLIPIGKAYLKEKHHISEEEALEAIRTHIQMCYDVCHIAVAFEEPKSVLAQLHELGIKVGKIQISSAIKVDFSKNPLEKIKAIAQYNEASYLHQVVALMNDGTFREYLDLTEAIMDFEENKHREWRVHFHVPLFIDTYGLLTSTQSEIVKTLKIQKEQPFSNHLEIETYTWGVLPPEVQIPLNESIAREIEWVQHNLKG